MYPLVALISSFLTIPPMFQSDHSSLLYPCFKFCLHAYICLHLPTVCLLFAYCLPTSCPPLPTVCLCLHTVSLLFAYCLPTVCLLVAHIFLLFAYYYCLPTGCPHFLTVCHPLPTHCLIYLYCFHLFNYSFQSVHSLMLHHHFKCCPPAHICPPCSHFCPPSVDICPHCVHTFSVIFQSCHLSVFVFCQWEIFENLKRLVSSKVFLIFLHN